MTHNLGPGVEDGTPFKIYILHLRESDQIKIVHKMHQVPAF